MYHAFMGPRHERNTHSTKGIRQLDHIDDNMFGPACVGEARISLTLQRLYVEASEVSGLSKESTDGNIISGDCSVTSNSGRLHLSVIEGKNYFCVIHEYVVPRAGIGSQQSTAPNTCAD